MTPETFMATIRDGDGIAQIHSDKQPTVGPAGELRVVARDGKTWIYSPTAWISYSYETPGGQPHVQ